MFGGNVSTLLTSLFGQQCLESKDIEELENFGSREGEIEMNTFMISFLSVSVSGLCMAGIVVLLEKLLKNHLASAFVTDSGCL